MTIDNDISDEEMEAIHELRERLTGDVDPEMHNDTYMYLRFLKVQDFNVNNAEAMLRNHIQWREKNDVKNIMKYQKTEVMEKYIPYVFLGYDKDGCVVRYCAIGSLDLIGMVASVAPEDITKVIIYECEFDTIELKKQTEKLQKPIDKCVYIFNVENFSFAVATDKKILYFLIQLLKLYFENYPDRIKAVYLLNVSMYFHIAYSVVKTILPKHVLEKIHLYSDESYKEVISEIIDADVLPAFLGGSRTDPDGNPLCLSVIFPCEQIPQTYYIQKNKRKLAGLPGVQKVTLGKASFHEVTLEVEEVGSYLEWEFETKCRDIGFGLFYNELIDGEEKITELVPITRIETEMYPETGTCLCERSGTYVVVFDNTYSWVRSKEIYYRAKVVTPKQHEAELNE